MINDDYSNLGIENSVLSLNRFHELRSKFTQQIVSHGILFYICVIVLPIVILLGIIAFVYLMKKRRSLGRREILHLQERFLNREPEVDENTNSFENETVV